MHDLLFASLREQARAIRQGEITSEGLVQAHIEHIRRVNPVINAVVQLPAERALAAARAADAALARGENPGPLHGVPFSVKDSIETAGVVCASGTQGRADHIPAQDAVMVQRLRAAGAIMLAKTNCPELALPFETDNLVYGRTNNPWDVTRTPGGSSGGGGALIAAGGVPLEVTVDAAASIRLPAHLCGISGIKPTTGRVPRTGHFPQIGGVVAPLSAAGPMARTVDDLSLVLPLLCGVDHQDPWCVPVPYAEPGAVAISSLRVAYHSDNGIMAADDATARAIQGVVWRLSGNVESITEDRPERVHDAVEILWGLFCGDGGVRLRFFLKRLGTRKISPALQKLLDRMPGLAMDTASFIGIAGRLDALRVAVMQFFRRYDVLVCPVAAYPAPPHGTLLEDEAADALSYTIVYNLAGVPCVAVPVTQSPDGLPIGVQVVAPPWREDVALAVAGMIEQDSGGYRIPPVAQSSDT